MSAPYWTAVASSWPLIEKSPSPRGADDDALRMQQLCGNCGRDAVAHRARARSELRAAAAELVEAVRPDRVVAGAVRQHRVVGQPVAQVAPSPRRTRGRRGAWGAGGSRGTPRAPARAARRGARRRPGAAPPRTAGEPETIAQVGLVDAAELVRVGVDVDQRLLRARRLEQRVLLRRDLAEARAEREQDVRLAHARGELRVHPDRQRTGVGGRRSCRRSPGGGTTRRPGCSTPPRTRSHRARPGRDQPPPPTTISGRSAPASSSSARSTSASAGDACEGWYGAASATSASSSCASSGSAITTGPGRPEVGRVERARDQLGDRSGVVGGGDELRHLAEHARVVELLERLSAEVGARHLADEAERPASSPDRRCGSRPPRGRRPARE